MTGRGKTQAADLETVSSFLFEEAALLDAHDWSTWLELFTADGMYWVPLTRDQPDPIDHVSLFYENAMMRKVRVRRLEQVRAWSQQPMVRTARLISNIRLLKREPGIDVIARSTFVLVEWRHPRQRLLAGTYTHRLVQTDGGLRIHQKRADLIDCEAPHNMLEMFL